METGRGESAVKPGRTGKSNLFAGASVSGLKFERTARLSWSRTTKSVKGALRAPVVPSPVDNSFGWLREKGLSGVEGGLGWVIRDALVRGARLTLFCSGTNYC